jgi:hypothetical protein
VKHFLSNAFAEQLERENLECIISFHDALLIYPDEIASHTLQISDSESILKSKLAKNVIESMSSSKSKFESSADLGNLISTYLLSQENSGIGSSSLEGPCSRETRQIEEKNNKSRAQMVLSSPDSRVRVTGSVSERVASPSATPSRRTRSEPAQDRADRHVDPSSTLAPNSAGRVRSLLITAAESAAEKLRSFLGLGADAHGAVDESAPGLASYRAKSDPHPLGTLSTQPKPTSSIENEKEKLRKGLLSPSFRDLSASSEWVRRSSYDEGPTKDFRRKLNSSGYIKYNFVDGGYSSPTLQPDPYACFHLRAIDERAYVYSYNLTRLLLAHIDQLNRGIVEPYPPPAVSLELPIRAEDFPGIHGPHPQVEKDFWTILNFDPLSLNMSQPANAPSSKYSEAGRQLPPRNEIHGLPVEKLHVLRKDAHVGHRINYRVFVVPPGLKREETTKSLEERNKIMYYWFVPI